jgi:hypothetical protein
MAPVFPLDLTEEETALGFRLRPVTRDGGWGVALVALEMADGLLAVKARRPDGAIEYAIWTLAQNVSLHPAAATLSELCHRFQPERAK